MATKEKMVKVLKSRRANLWNRWRRIFKIDRINLRKIHLPNGGLEFFNLKKCDFSSGYFRYTRFPDIIIECNFTDACLTHSDFRKTIVQDTNFTRAYLARTVFDYSEIKSSNFTDADFVAPYFKGVTVDENTILPENWKNEVLGL